MNLPYDAGLQAERTALAWKRTDLVVMATALIVLRLGMQDARVSLQLGCALFSIFAGAFVLLAYLRWEYLIAKRCNSHSGLAVGVASLLTTAAALLGSFMLLVLLA